MDATAQSAHVFGNDNIVVQASGSGVNVAIGPQAYLKLTRYENRQSSKPNAIRKPHG